MVERLRVKGWMQLSLLELDSFLRTKKAPETTGTTDNRRSADQESCENFSPVGHHHRPASQPTHGAAGQCPTPQGATLSRALGSTTSSSSKSARQARSLGRRLTIASAEQALKTPSSSSGLKRQARMA